MVIGTHVVVNLTLGPGEARKFTQREEHQIIFYNVRPAPYKNPKGAASDPQALLALVSQG